MFADVIVDINNSEVDKIFEYSFYGDQLKVGCRVRVPFGPQVKDGIVISIKNDCSFSPEKVKSILCVYDEPPVLNEETLKLSKFISDNYYVTRAGSLRLFLPSEMRAGRVKKKIVSYLLPNKNVDLDKEITALRKVALKKKALLKELKEKGELILSEANKKFSPSSLKSLIKSGVVYVEERKCVRTPYAFVKGALKEVSLTPAQQNALNVINNSKNPYSLIFGVTGSGKTEVYLKLIENALKNGKTAIMLVPEISLTPQMFRQLKARFSSSVAILHSGLSAGERFDEWWRLKNGEAKIAVGARSAIFAPLENLGVIIIDEEHDGSYVSESAPRYSTMELAKFRANYNNAKIVIGSATPSVESFLKAKLGEYNLIEMPERINKRAMPEIEIVDMRNEIRKGNNSPFSSSLISELENCLSSGNQAMIFINQRGYSRSVICTSCGHVIKCDSCDVSLTYHMEDNSLLCHYCGAKYKMVDSCPSCGSKYLKYSGTGTERIVEALKSRFKNCKILRMDRDTTVNKESHLKILSDFSEKKADILVGTQMIAKGHDFPSVTLVGILDADMGLYFSDFRSSERAFQLITQVSGRAGRGTEKGKVILQTYSPENTVLKKATSYDYVGFYEHEISIRKATAFPPFTDIVRILISGEDEEKTLSKTKEINDAVKIIYEQNKSKFRFFGCMKAPLKRLQDKFRYQILMRINANSKDIYDLLNGIVKSFNSKTASVWLEINPNNLT